MPDNPLTEHRWVRIMCDYCADGVWAKEGGACSAEDLPVDPSIRARIRAWQDLYDSRATEALISDWEHWNHFNTEGLAIAKAVKSELPGWTVIFFDEAASEAASETTEQPRALFEYEICATDAETHAARLATAVEQLGLVAGETRVREGDVEGVYREALNIIDGRLWIAVRTDKPNVINGRSYGHGRKFYGDWVRIS